MFKENDRIPPVSTIEHFPNTLGTDTPMPIAIKVNNHSKINGLFQQFKSHFFNELVDDQTISEETRNKIEQWLSQHTIDELKALNQAAKDHFLYEGITFTVYGESEGIERTIPYDLN